MFKNYLRVATRQLVKNWRHTLINVLELSLALACCIVAYLNHDFAYGSGSLEAPKLHESVVPSGLAQLANP